MESVTRIDTRKDAAKAWIAAVLWLILIAIESTDWLSSANTSRILFPILHFLTNVDPVRFEVWNYYIRKAGHVVGYFGLSVLLFRAWRATLQLPNAAAWAWRWAATAFVMSSAIAAADEWHQTFIPSRTGTLRDVALDSAAALAGQFLVYGWLSRSAHRTPLPGQA